VDPIEQLAERDAGWTQALRARDQSRVVEYLHDDYALTLVHPVAAFVARPEWLRTLDGYLIEHWDVRGSHWDVLPTMAAHLQLIDQRADVLGSRRDGLFAITDVWLPVAGRWVVWRRHSTPLTAGEIPRR
jgi:hypothetical protein